MRKLKNEELDRKSVAEFKASEKIPLIIVLDNIRSAMNVGSVFRTADAFMVEAIYLCGITAQPPQKDILKTALGSTSSIEWKYFSNTKEAVQQLKNVGFKIFAVEQVEGSVDLDQFRIEGREKTAIIFGHEINGVQQEVIQELNGCIEIPQFGTKHSLNLAVCAGIVIYRLYHLYNKQ